MSRTERRKRPQFHKASKGKARDGSRQHASASCEHHGGCSWCEGNRLHKHERRAPLEMAQINNIHNDENWTTIDEIIEQSMADPKMRLHIIAARKKLAPILFPNGGPNYKRLMRGEGPSEQSTQL